MFLCLAPVLAGQWSILVFCSRQHTGLLSVCWFAVAAAAKLGGDMPPPCDDDMLLDLRVGLDKGPLQTQQLRSAGPNAEFGTLAIEDQSGIQRAHAQ